MLMVCVRFFLGFRITTPLSGVTRTPQFGLPAISRLGALVAPLMMCRFRTPSALLGNGTGLGIPSGLRVRVLTGRGAGQDSLTREL
jgi:hypothetical protein